MSAGRIKKSIRDIGESLLGKGLVSPQQWEKVKAEAGDSPEALCQNLIRSGFLSENDAANFMAEQMNIPRIRLNDLAVDPKIIDLIPARLARKHSIVPVFKMGNRVTCAMADVFNIVAIDEVLLRTGLTVEPAITTETEIKKALDQYYDMTAELGEVRESPDAVSSPSQHGGRREAAGNEEAPVIKYVNGMIARALALGASDIHIEPEEGGLNVRYRIDGVLHAQPAPLKEFQSAIISRIKILADLNIAESRRSQDGRFRTNVEKKSVDIRVSCLPTLYGENVVLRVLDTGSVLLGLEKIGLQNSGLEIYKTLLRKPNGIILVTGPTGSGKTTTLYSSLSILNTPGKSIVTIEDPVEYHLPGIRQTQVDLQVGLTFAAGLRAVLRQDPDIIMVGEIRDAETAQIAIQAALTGHLVLATLHTNNAAGAVSRLLDLGIEPFLLASSIIGVLGQRLVRLLCLACRGQGCAQCLNTGYKGRSGIYELMVPDERIRALIMHKAPTEEIHKAAVLAGMQNMRDNGLDKVAAGLTRQEEIFRVTNEG